MCALIFKTKQFLEDFKVISSVKKYGFDFIPFLFVVLLNYELILSTN